MPTVTNDGVRISYSVTGRGRPLVLLHGWLNDRTWWAETGYVDDLRRDHRLVSVDLRGHGRSDKPHEPSAYHAESFASDVLAVADAEGLERFAMWGLSYGGWVAWMTADAAPDRVPAFITTGSWDPRPTPYTPGVTPEDPDLAVIRRGGIAAVIERYEGDEYRFPAAIRAVMLRADPQAMIASQAGELLPDGVDKLGSFQVPALLISGQREDEEGGAVLIAGKLPHGESLTLPGLGHAAACAASSLALPTARAFLDRWFGEPA
jgi:pimeloyl-ACP methyl ester carboxylesterase